MSASPSKKKRAPDHPKYQDMIITAITDLKEPKGSSRQAIKKYVEAHYKVRENIGRKLMLSLRRLVQNGKLINTKGSGASGSFKLPEKKPKSANKPAAKKPAAKKPAAKKPAAKKPAAKKAATRKSTGKSPAKKAVEKPATKPAAEKAKKPAAKKAAKKPAAKKPAAKKPAAKKAGTRKSVGRPRKSKK